jgi:hypothetical protein
LAQTLGVTITPENTMSIFPFRHFASLHEGIAYLNDKYSGEVLVESKDRRTLNQIGGIPSPKFLFRGESSQYATTTATMQRISGEQCLSPRARDLVPGIVKYLEEHLRDFLNMSEMESAGFAQHYGLPTELIDLTSSPKTAGFFATGGMPGTSGYLAAFPVTSLASSSILIDLRNHTSAERPRRQDAFAIFNRRHTDLKSNECVAELCSTWFTFTLHQSDKDLYYYPQLSLLDCHTDVVAGALQLVVDSMVQKHGKLPDELAAWFSKRIAAAPFLTKPTKWGASGNPAEVELVALSSTGIPYNEESERENSYRYWSSKYSVSTRRVA